mmetsp:Transcript_31121/g.72454  ORF Transcript_31121/g.72454 Transcript_31121/m.72454 type:complete len:478 (-) Transcript_31121:167-1600(-)|eukprot:CAMPEP_0178384932 /NCGR_PEP_ID=MMETSP0689_2-20121128/7773_1 /TAXON_ID=160604 /ORGANISM="Amphidinium massartii, Strain CS-259" /LENGTH=477 /DNA_ID=CAMNT_0020005201 /DNA_START=57 /DNA_END=1490 /DNA_ORIENTATION=+
MHAVFHVPAPLAALLFLAPAIAGAHGCTAQSAESSQASVCLLQTATNFAVGRENISLDSGVHEEALHGSELSVAGVAANALAPELVREAQGLVTAPTNLLSGHFFAEADMRSSAAYLHEWLWHDLFKTRMIVEETDRLFAAASASEWLVLLSTTIILMLVEVFVMRGLGGTFMRNMAILAFWLSIGVAYNIYFIARYGWNDGIEWTTGYILEWMLSMDNLFVFHLIFQVYQTPPGMQNKALFVGVTGAVILKLLFFVIIGLLVHLMSWVRFFFGALLIYSGIEAIRSEDEDHDPSDSFFVWLVKLTLGDRLWEHYDLEGNSIFMKSPQDGRWSATLLFMVIMCLELTDVIFAVDSVSAKVGQIPNMYIAYSSSVLAIFSLRAMFFVINDLVAIFEHLKYGICLILVFIGFELIGSEWIDLPPMTVCIVIVSVFLLSILSSIPKAGSQMIAKEDEECLSGDSNTKASAEEDASTEASS